MRKGMLVKFFNCFLCLVIAFLMLSSPLAGKAQNTSVINVAGTSWDAGSVLLPTPNTGDGSLMTRRRLYDFDKQSKVKSTVLIDTSAGGILKYEYNALSGRYENKYEMTMPTSRSETITGTYEIKGKSIYLDFPDYTVRATIYSDSMKGVLTYKSTNEKEEWVVSKKSGTITSVSNTDALTPRANIQKLWVDHKVYDKQKKGMRVHFTFNALNLKGKTCKANVYFYYASGKPLKDTNDKFSTTNGNVAMYADFTPTYERSIYKDFQLFMPYDELHVPTGEFNLKLKAKLHCEKLGFIAQSEDYTFSYSRK